MLQKRAAMYKRVPSQLWLSLRSKFTVRSAHQSHVRWCQVFGSLEHASWLENIETVAIVNLQFFYYYNHTPSSRSYSDVVDAWADCACIYQLILKCHLKTACIN